MHKLFLPGLFALVLLLAHTAWAEETIVTGYLLGEQQGKGRFTLDLTGKADYKVFLLNNPHRLVIDIKDSIWAVDPALDYKAASISPLVMAVRYGIQEGGHLRIVLDMAQAVRVTHTMVMASGSNAAPSYRLEVNIEEDRAQPSVIEVKAQQRAPLIVPVIVIDPGHGGDDPGTIGRVNGTYEKNITLDYGIALKRALEQEGQYKVVLTRNSDYFIPLGERVNIARKAKGDLFISLHANSHPKTTMAGLSVYTVSDTASDKEAEMLAAAENRDMTFNGLHVFDENKEMAPVLINLMQRQTRNVSAEFAEGAVMELGKEVQMLRNTHRFAGFKVLKGVDVPAVLFELGYLSNPEEEKLLASPPHQHKIIQAMVRAVNAHFDRKQYTER